MAAEVSCHERLASPLPVAVDRLTSACLPQLQPLTYARMREPSALSTRNLRGAAWAKARPARAGLGLLGRGVAPQH